jgi:hypothetical protein
VTGRSVPARSRLPPPPRKRDTSTVGGVLCQLLEDMFGCLGSAELPSSFGGATDRAFAWAAPTSSRVGVYHKFSGLGPPPPFRALSRLQPVPLRPYPRSVPLAVSFSSQTLSLTPVLTRLRPQ